MSTLPDPLESRARAAHFDETIGHLAATERTYLAGRKVMAVSNRYEAALLACQEAREHVLASARGTRAMLAAIDAYRDASIALYMAARAVCDAENLPNDGEAAGIQWRVPMVREHDSPEQAAARVADDHFCPSCGRRGYRFTCPTCAEAA